MANAQGNTQRGGVPPPGIIHTAKSDAPLDRQNDFVEGGRWVV